MDMANWCYNSGCITGPANIIEEIHNRFVAYKNKAQETGDDRNIYYELVDPDVLNFKTEILGKLAGMDDIDYVFEHIATVIGKSYEQIENDNVLLAFGLCENEYGTDEIKGTGLLHYSFESAWGPSLLFIEYLIKRFPEISINQYYEESGCHVYGKAVYNAGDDPVEYTDYNCSDSKCIESSRDIYSFVQDYIEGNPGATFSDVKAEAKTVYAASGCNVCPYQRTDSIKCEIMTKDFFEDAVTADFFDDELEDCYVAYKEGHKNE